MSPAFAHPQLTVTHDGAGDFFIYDLTAGNPADESNFSLSGVTIDGDGDGFAGRGQFSVADAGRRVTPVTRSTRTRSCRSTSVTPASSASRAALARSCCSAWL